MLRGAGKKFSFPGYCPPRKYDVRQTSGEVACGAFRRVNAIDVRGVQCKSWTADDKLKINGERVRPQWSALVGASVRLCNCLLRSNLVLAGCERRLTVTRESDFPGERIAHKSVSHCIHLRRRLKI